MLARSSTDGRSTWPSFTSRFVGREELADRLAAQVTVPGGLTTLTGPPGVGKTRLAAEVARSCRRDLRGAAWFCDLAGETTAWEILAAVGRGVGVELAGATTVDAAVGRIAEGLAPHDRGLCVLDNAEQAVEVVHDLVEAWLTAVPGVHWLVTSRVRLELEAEEDVPVPPLAHTAGTALFHQMARRLDGLVPDELDEADAARLDRIVAALDRLPLALELAAGRTELMDLSQLEHRLGRPDDLLARPSAGRHARLWGAIEESWRTLPPEVAATLAAVSVFPGRIAPDAVEGILGPDALGHLAVATRMNLLRAEGDGFAMLVSIRAFGAGRLAEDIRAELERVHLAWHGARARITIDEVESGRTDPWLVDALPAAAATARRALRTRPDDPASVTHALAIAVAIASITWTGRAPLALIAELLDGATAAADALEDMDPTLVARALARRGAVRHRQRRRTEGQADLDRALTLADDTGEPRLRAWARATLSQYARRAADLITARALAADAVAIAEAAGDGPILAYARTAIGWILLDEERHDDAVPYVDEARAAAAACGATRYLADLCIVASTTHGEQGFAERALDLDREAIVLYEQLGAELSAAIALSSYGTTLLATPAWREGIAHLRDAIHRQRLLVEYSFLVTPSVFYGKGLLMDRQLDDAGRVLTEACAHAESVGFRRPQSIGLGLLALVHIAAGDLDDAEKAVETAIALAPPRDAVTLANHHAWAAILTAARALAADPRRQVAPLDDAAARVGELAELMDPSSRWIASDTLADLRAAATAHRIAADGTWHHPPGLPRVDVDEQSAIGVLATLATRHGDGPIPPDELLAAGWPGTSLVPSSGSNRLRGVIHRLRDEGMTDILLNHRGRGYLLDPDANIAIVP